MRKFVVVREAFLPKEYSSAAEAIRAHQTSSSRRISSEISTLIKGDEIADFGVSENQVEFLLRSEFVLRLAATRFGVEWWLGTANAARREVGFEKVGPWEIQYSSGKSVVDPAAVLGPRVGDRIRFVDFGNDIAVVHFIGSESVMFFSNLDSISGSYFLSFDVI